MRGLRDFEGRWRLRRLLRVVGLEYVFDGDAVLEPGRDHHVWTETGTLRLDGGQPHHAERRYLWREADGLIEVLYDDGRPFHAFDPNAGEVEVEHRCDPDTYIGRYDFTAFPEWSLGWDVRGPRKAYTSVTVHERLEPTAPLRDTAANET